VDPELLAVRASHIWEVVVRVWHEVTALLVERAIEVELDKVRVLGKVWALRHGHVEWVLLVDQVEVPSVLGLLIDHVVDGIDLGVDQLADLWQLLFDHARDSGLEV